jgi:hypothetical protein
MRSAFTLPLFLRAAGFLLARFFQVNERSGDEEKSDESESHVVSSCAANSLSYLQSYIQNLQLGPLSERQQGYVSICLVSGGG